MTITRDALTAILVTRPKQLERLLRLRRLILAFTATEASCRWPLLSS